MNCLRKLFGLMTVMLLLCVALPARADRDDEKFSLKVVATATPGTFTATITNTTRDDDDKIKSFKITVPTSPSGVAITGVTAVGGTGTTAGYTRDPAAATFSSSYVTFKNVSIKSNQNVVVTFTATLPNATSCGSTNYKWGAKAWDGSSASGDEFDLSSSDADRTTSVSNNCAMSFVSGRQPQNALVGTNITSVAYNPSGAGVQVQLLVNGAAPNPPVSVTLANASGACLASTPAAVATDSAGLATFSGLTSKSTAGTGCTLKATATTATGYPVPTSSTFNVSVPTLAFVNQPKNALSGVIITDSPNNSPSGSFIKVLLQFDGSAAPAGFPVTMTSNCSALAGGSPPVSTNGSGIATFSALSITNATALTGCTLTASAVGLSVTSTPATGFAIAPFVPALNPIACDQQLPQVEISPTGNPLEPGYVFAQRGLWNTKGDACALVNYQFQNKILSDGFLVNRWDTVTQPNASFLYIANSKARLLDPLTGTPVVNPPKVAWEFDGAGAPINKLPALACIGTKLPVPYGTLPVAGLGSGDGSVVLNTVPPSGTVYQALPPVGATFPIYIDAERMDAKVASVGAGVATVTLIARGTAGTTATAHSASAYAMSTPLPIDPRASSPYFGKAVHMCMVEYGFQAYTPDPVTGAARYFQTTSVFDNGDGFIGTDE